MQYYFHKSLVHSASFSNLLFCEVSKGLTDYISVLLSVYVYGTCEEQYWCCVTANHTPRMKNRTVFYTKHGNILLTLCEYSESLPAIEDVTTIYQRSAEVKHEGHLVHFSTVMYLSGNVIYSLYSYDIPACYKSFQWLPQTIFQFDRISAKLWSIRIFR